MSSIHSQRSFEIAAAKGAQAAASWARWSFLTDMSKRELCEIICHLVAAQADSCDEMLGDDDALIERIREERQALEANGLI